MIHNADAHVSLIKRPFSVVDTRTFRTVHAHDTLDDAMAGYDRSTALRGEHYAIREVESLVIGSDMPGWIRGARVELNRGPVVLPARERRGMGPISFGGVLVRLERGERFA